MQVCLAEETKKMRSKALWMELKFLRVEVREQRSRGEDRVLTLYKKTWWFL